MDPQTRHGHKTSARGFDGFKGHIAVDPDSEIITNTVVTAGNAGDAGVVADLIDDLTTSATADAADTAEAEKPTVYGDSSYGTGEFHQHLEEHDIDDRCKTQQPVGRNGMFAKDAFTIDLDNDTVTCPNGVTVPVRRNDNGDGTAYFADACTDCPLRAQCTKAGNGRTIKVGRHEKQLTNARQRQRRPQWKDGYRATRPKVERKLAHLTRRGRQARRRGTVKIGFDFNLQAAAENLARLARLGLRFLRHGWAVSMA